MEDKHKDKKNAKLEGIKKHLMCWKGFVDHKIEISVQKNPIDSPIVLRIGTCSISTLIQKCIKTGTGNTSILLVLACSG
jgi:hypothetical protein